MTSSAAISAETFSAQFALLTLRMTPEHRNKLLRRLCLFGPLLSAASIVFVAFTPLRGLLLRSSHGVIPGLDAFASGAPLIGWFVLTLGCSAFTSLDFLGGRKERYGSTAFVMLAIAGTGLVFLIHLILIGGIAFAGCMIALSH
jgi:hypothetical protein